MIHRPGNVGPADGEQAELRVGWVPRGVDDVDVELGQEALGRRVGDHPAGTAVHQLGEHRAVVGVGDAAGEPHVVGAGAVVLGGGDAVADDQAAGGRDHGEPPVAVGGRREAAQFAGVGGGAGGGQVERRRLPPECAGVGDRGPGRVEVGGDCALERGRVQVGDLGGGVHGERGVPGGDVELGGGPAAGVVGPH